MKEIIEVNGIKYKRINEKKLVKGSYVKISGILFRCFEEKNRLCTTVKELREEIVQKSAYHIINKKCVDGNKVMFNSNIIDNEYGSSVIRKLLQGFETKYLDTSKLNKVFGKDHVRLLKKEEIEELGEELHKSIDSWYWTMTRYSNDSDTYAYVFFVWGSSYPGSLSYVNVHITSGVVRPVVSLKSDVLLTGDGTLEKPFELV